MVEYTIGSIVISKSGRDKGEHFVVCEIDTQFLYLVDGKKRKLENPKKKKKKHVQITKYVDEGIKEKIETAQKINNADFRKVIEKYHGGVNLG